jgi:Bacterial regulatory proteins, lacI family
MPRDSAPWRYDEMTTNSLSGRNVPSCTVIDIARLAGVSTATVSRVVNGSGSVSRKTKAKVLSTISGLRYRPNTHAAELGRENRGVPRKRGTYVAASTGAAAKLISDPGDETLSKRRIAGRLHLLEDENSRLRRQLADLTLQLETLKRIAESC